MKNYLKNYNENKRILKNNVNIIKRLKEIEGEASTSSFSSMPTSKRTC